jgi:hypothetical protein
MSYLQKEEPVKNGKEESKKVDVPNGNDDGGDDDLDIDDI